MTGMRLRGILGNMKSILRRRMMGYGWLRDRIMRLRGRFELWELQ